MSQPITLQEVGRRSLSGGLHVALWGAVASLAALFAGGTWAVATKVLPKARPPIVSSGSSQHEQAVSNWKYRIEEQERYVLFTVRPRVLHDQSKEHQKMMFVVWPFDPAVQKDAATNIKISDLYNIPRPDADPLTIKIDCSDFPTDVGVGDNVQLQAYTVPVNFDAAACKTMGCLKQGGARPTEHHEMVARPDLSDPSGFVIWFKSLPDDQKSEILQELKQP